MTNIHFFMLSCPTYKYQANVLVTQINSPLQLPIEKLKVMTGEINYLNELNYPLATVET